MASSSLRPAPGVLAPVFLVLVVVLLAVTLMEDPDAWTHLALGRDLVQRGGFPTHEPLSFPSTQLPYHNTEWLFDVVLYAAWAAAGLAGVIGLKAAIVALGVWILWLDSRPAGATGPPAVRHLLVRLAVLLGTVLVIRHRFVERPDIALLVFLAVTIYALDAYLDAGRRLIFALPIVYVVWANVHPSLIVGVVPFAAVLGGGLPLRLLQIWRGRPIGRAPTWRQLATVAGVAAAVLGASLLNPRGAETLLMPFRLVDLSWFRQEIFELQPPRFADTPAPFVIAALLAVTFLLTARRLPLIEILLVLPFLQLGLSAVRFVFLLAVVAAPILARNLNVIGDALVARVGGRAPLGAAAAAVAAGAVAVALTLGQLGPFADPRKVTGVGVNERYVPEGALRYLDRAGVHGRVFNTFHWGGYLAWRDRPHRAPIVDGRGHVEPRLLQEIHFARVYARHLERLAAAYGIEVAVVDYPTFSGDRVEDVIGPDADAGLASPAWALVYWDDVALVYLRRGGRHAALIARDEYRQVKPANGAAGITRLKADAARLDAARAELRRNLDETGSSLSSLLLGYAALSPRAAIAAWSRVHDPRHRYEVYQALAGAHAQLDNTDAAQVYYEETLRMQEAATVHYQIALVHAQAGRQPAALRALERAQRLDPDLLVVYPELVAAYRARGDEASARALEPAFERARTRAQVEQQVRTGVQRLAAGHLTEAATALEAAVRLDPGSALAQSTLGTVRFYQGRLDEAARGHYVALQADPTFARGHWGLAQLARRRGDPAAARAHLERFVRLSPRSYEAWQAREELARVRLGSAR